jgi:hypothetical protein
MRRYYPLLLIALLLFLGLGLRDVLRAQDQFGSNWSAVYFSDINFTTTVGTDTVQAVNFNYGNNPPTCSGCAGLIDNWSARFTSVQNFTQGTYTFTVTRDDAVQVFLDGNLILNHNEGGSGTFQTTTTVQGGARSLRVDYKDFGGAAQVIFSWRQVDTSLGGSTLVYGTSGTGNIAAANGTQGFTFAGNAGDSITIAVTPSNSTIQTAITLLGPSGQTVATGASPLSATLPQSGTYSITVTALGGTSGAFTILVTKVGTTMQLITGTVTRVRGLAQRSGPYLGATLRGVARPDINYSVVARNRDEGLYTWYLIEVPLGVASTAPSAGLSTQIVQSTQTVQFMPLAPAIAPNPTLAAERYERRWVSGRYFTITGDPNSLPFITSIFDQVNNAPEVGVLAAPRAPMNLRRRPSTRTPVLAEIPWGALVPVIGRTVQGPDNFWYQVIYNGQVGWIYAPFISIRGDLDTVPIR